MNPLRVELSGVQEVELGRRLRARDLSVNERMRLECVRLSAQGRTVPQIALIVVKHVVTVRKALHRFAGGGIEALADAPRPGRPPCWAREDLDALEAMLDDSAAMGRTWTLPGLAQWLRLERGVDLDSSWLSVLLHRDGFRWKRTRDSLRHLADEVLQQAARAQLEDLRTEAAAGTRDLIFLDESGFAPTMPTGYTWSRTGQRAVVPREDTRDRRVNVLGSLFVGTAPDLLWECAAGKIDAGVLLEFVCSELAGLPGGAAALALAADGASVPVWRRPRPCTVALDNASAHVAKAFKGRRDQLARIGVDLFYLPPRSPELNAIERIWRSAKYEDYPDRAHTSIDAIEAAVDRALTRQQTRIRGSAANFTQAA
ncbi:IS630 family transposase [Streptomyces sp. NPDC096311]|uniref:IS630 family transposase n=1 Tax=Streptomyces sp. NPDC096311 TaxID=3366083 RepID=UPI0038060DCC